MSVFTVSEGIEPYFIFGNPEAIRPIDRVISCICDSVKTEKIFLLGIYPVFPSSLGPEYDLLVLVDPEYNRPLHELESLISNRCHDLVMITVSVLKIDMVIDQLADGNIFFSNLCDSSKIVFDRGLYFPGSRSTKKFRTDDLEKDFLDLFEKARSFYAGAVNYQISDDLQLAAFMLHQTVEQALNAFLSPFIGHRLQTHNLNKLFIFARRLCPDLYSIFPRNSDREIRLYQILHKAYIYGRYKNNFKIEPEILQLLIHRIASFLEKTTSAFLKKLTDLKKRNEII